MQLIPRKATQTGRLRREPAIRDGLKAREKRLEYMTSHARAVLRD